MRAHSVSNFKQVHEDVLRNENYSGENNGLQD